MLAAAAYEGGRTAGYLDTATYGLPPRQTVDALRAAIDGWRDWQSWLEWEQDGEACRELFARVVGARAADVSLQPAASVAAGLVAASLPVRAGDNVVCYQHEFHSALFPFLALEQKGVEVRLLPLEEMAGAVDDRTALVAVSSVQSSDGRLADLAALKATGAPLFVDGTQSVGALPIDLGSIDFLAVAGYKWLLCPRGTCFFWVHPDRLAAVEPWNAGWRSYERLHETYYGPPRDLARDARRLDASVAWLLVAGARPSLELIADLGVERIARHDLSLARRFCDGLGIPETGSAIVRVNGTEEDVARLEAAGVRCATRAGAMRFAFHLYNTDEDVDRAVSALAGR